MQNCYKCGGTEKLRAKSKFSMICRPCTNQEAAKYRARKRHAARSYPVDRSEWEQLAKTTNDRIALKYAS